MNVKTHQTLWNKIQQFQLDDPSANIKFSDKLARENSWSAELTSRAIIEYKKFIFLCCISPAGAWPSPMVDEVWHLHLTYTQNYWKDFCQNTLEKEIHHHPSKGGESERDKHKAWYEKTLELYRDVFEESPPADIWPSQQSLLSAEELPPLHYFKAYRKHLYLLLIPFLLPLFFSKFHPFQFTGPQFLWFYGALLVATAIFLLRVRSEKKRMLNLLINETPIHTSNWYAVARFVYGRHRAIEAAVVDLVSKGVLIAEPNEQFIFCPEKLDDQTLATNPLAANLRSHHSQQPLLRIKDLNHFYDEGLTYDASLASLYRRTKRKDFSAFAISIAVMLFGLIRMKQGSDNGYPISYLSFMVFIGGFVLMVMAALLSTSTLFHTVFTQRYQENMVPASASESLLPKFVLLGVAALAGTYAFANLENIFRNHRRDSGDNTVSSGCGSPGCGSSCGGGCGGCGGGD